MAVCSAEASGPHSYLDCFKPNSFIWWVPFRVNVHTCCPSAFPHVTPHPAAAHARAHALRRLPDTRAMSPGRLCCATSSAMCATPAGDRSASATPGRRWPAAQEPNTPLELCPMAQTSSRPGWLGLPAGPAAALGGSGTTAGASASAKSRPAPAVCRPAQEQQLQPSAFGRGAPLQVQSGAKHQAGAVHDMRMLCAPCPTRSMQRVQCLQQPSFLPV